MIAPIRHNSTTETTARLTPARRAVADLFFSAPPAAGSARPPIARWVGWLFVGWAFAMVTSYLLRSGWWSRGS